RNRSVATVADAVTIDIVEYRAGDLHLEEKDVGLEIIVDSIVGENLRKRDVLERITDQTGVDVLEPEPVAVANALELVGDDSLEERPKAAAGDMVFRQTSYPKIDVVDVAVELLELGLDVGIGRDLSKTGNLWQAVSGADGVVVGQAVVAAALDVERGQVEAA